MRNKRVLIYGGTRLPDALARFVSDLAYRLLENESIRVMTGGFGRSAETREGEMSTDMAALRGAQAFGRGVALDETLEIGCQTR